MRKFKYCPLETTYLGELEIDDIGNFCIEAIDTDKYYVYYMCVYTKYGKTTIFKQGPFVLDSIKLPDSTSCSIISKEFSDFWIIKELNKFLLSQKGVKISQVNLIDRDELFNRCRNLVEEMKFIISLYDDEEESE